MTTSSVSHDSDNLKQCTKCHEWKPREAFSRDCTAPDGLQYRCKACKSAYRTANHERDRKRDREYRAATREWISERDRVYRVAYAERNRENKRVYRQTDAGKAAQRASRHNRRARKMNAEGSYTIADLAAIRAAQTDKRGRLICWRCGKPIKGTPHLDHWQPLKHGGRNDAGNLHYMHCKCNLEKAAKMPTELGRLI